MVSKFKRNKKGLKNKIFSGFFVVLILFVVGFIIYTNWKINRRRQELIDRVSVLRGEVQELEQKNRELKEKKDKAGSEDYLEQVARDQLDLKKPGEEVVVVQKEDSSEENQEEEEKKSWWDKFKSIFQK